MAPSGAMIPARPTLYFDGHCGFCRRWIPRWRELTGDRVDYRAVLGDETDLAVDPAAVRLAVHLVVPAAAADDAPEPASTDLAPDAGADRSAAHPIEPLDAAAAARDRLCSATPAPAEGPAPPAATITRGAAAVAELGRFTGRVPVFRTLYRRVPGARPVADWAYRLVARHRVAADRATRLFVGPDLRRPRHALVRWLFLRLLALTALAAVLSWWVQVDGLVGPRGLAPADAFLDGARAWFERQGDGALERLHQLPTVLWLGAGTAALHLVCAAAAAGALLLLFNLLPGLGLVLLWTGYLSLVTVGGVFMGYQWDALLLEALLVAFFLVPWRAGVRPGLAPAHAPSWAGLWLARLLVLKVMFLAGVVKLASGDPVWADLTALDYHFWTQPLPTPASWPADAATWAHVPLVVFTFVAELALPVLALTGLRRLRALACAGTLALMLGLGVTGNYGFFHLLTGALAVTLLDDAALRALVPRRLRARVPDTHTLPLARPRLRNRAPAAVLAAIVVTLSLTRAVGRLAPDAVPGPLRELAAFVAPLHVADSYGLFAVMTTERPEIVIAGSRDGHTWRPYRFAWKPDDDLTTGGVFAGPHLPRLDWQLWFAALEGHCARVRWYPALLLRLLEGEPAVVGLFAGDPFPHGPPRYLRSTLWYYRFATPEEQAQSGQRWVREGPDGGPRGATFCPTVTLVDGELQAVPQDGDGDGDAPTGAPP